MALINSCVSVMDPTIDSWRSKPFGIGINFKWTSQRNRLCVAHDNPNAEFTGELHHQGSILHLPMKLHKDSNNLPKPLSVSDLSANPDDSKVRISFKGMQGSYSEEAALKVYPNCQTVPCDEFEGAFKAVELWLADRAVLPIENSSDGSIHRNYDLLLRHRLHIVGEVQLSVNLCLLALSGIRIEQLHRVISHPQALTLSDDFLSKLGVTRVNVDDSAGAAQPQKA